MISHTNWQVIRLDEVKPTPWRNGGGITRELIAWPDALNWQWRASVAEVARAGPFSSFPGVQRWFAVLAGDGVGLTVDGQLHELRTSNVPLCFEGAAKTHCELLGGAIQDFNLMVQGSAKARMQRVCSTREGKGQLKIETPKIIAVYADTMPATMLFGYQKLTLMAHSFGWMHVDSRTAVEVDCDDALVMEIEV